MEMVKYNHPGDTKMWFRQFKSDPLPAWAVNVQPDVSEEENLRNAFRGK